MIISLFGFLLMLHSVQINEYMKVLMMKSDEELYVRFLVVVSGAHLTMYRTIGLTD